MTFAAVIRDSFNVIIKVEERPTHRAAPRQESRRIGNKIIRYYNHYKPWKDLDIPRTT